MISCIPEMITNEDNIILTKVPEETEIKVVVFSMNSDSSSCPDVFNRKFFQTCRDIIKTDIIAFVHDFFKLRSLTKLFTHTFLALIPKVDSPSSFVDLRPISLSNYTNKIVSKILSNGLNALTPS